MANRKKEVYKVGTMTEGKDVDGGVEYERPREECAENAGGTDN